MMDMVWCPEEAAEDCRWVGVGDHVHVIITSPGSRRIIPSCRKTSLRLFFWDLDPEMVQRTRAFANDPDKGKSIIDGCFTLEQARQLVSFIRTCPDDVTHAIVNCEAGVSRSPAVVLAFLRHAKDPQSEEILKKAIPNLHVVRLLGQAFAEGR